MRLRGIFISLFFTNFINAADFIDVLSASKAFQETYDAPIKAFASHSDNFRGAGAAGSHLDDDAMREATRQFLQSKDAAMESHKTIISQRLQALREAAAAKAVEDLPNGTPEEIAAARKAALESDNDNLVRQAIKEANVNPEATNPLPAGSDLTDFGREVTPIRRPVAAPIDDVADDAVDGVDNSFNAIPKNEQGNQLRDPDGNELVYAEDGQTLRGIRDEETGLIKTDDGRLVDDAGNENIFGPDGKIIGIKNEEGVIKNSNDEIVYPDGNGKYYTKDERGNNVYGKDANGNSLDEQGNIIKVPWSTGAKVAAGLGVAGGVGLTYWAWQRHKKNKEAAEAAAIVPATPAIPATDGTGGLDGGADTNSCFDSTTYETCTSGANCIDFTGSPCSGGSTGGGAGAGGNGECFDIKTYETCSSGPDCIDYSGNPCSGGSHDGSSGGSTGGSTDGPYDGSGLVSGSCLDIDTYKPCTSGPSCIDTDTGNLCGSSGGSSGGYDGGSGGGYNGGFGDYGPGYGPGDGYYGPGDGYYGPGDGYYGGGDGYYGGGGSHGPGSHGSGSHGGSYGSGSNGGSYGGVTVLPPLDSYPGSPPGGYDSGYGSSDPLTDYPGGPPSYPSSNVLDSSASRGLKKRCRPKMAAVY